MLKFDLVDQVARESSLTHKAAGRAVNSLEANILKCIFKDRRIWLSGFGTFKLKVRAARIARNPYLNVAISLPPRFWIQFSPSPKVKKKLLEMSRDHNSQTERGDLLMSEEGKWKSKVQKRTF